MFASYLDIQKQIILEELDEREVRGRWKRFCGKWCAQLRSSESRKLLKEFVLMKH